MHASVVFIINAHSPPYHSNHVLCFIVFLNTFHKQNANVYIKELEYAVAVYLLIILLLNISELMQSTV